MTLEETCREKRAALIECARHTRTPDAGLEAHLADCPTCAERYAAECDLTSALRVMRYRANRIEADERPLAWANREDLMRGFAWRHRRSFSWGWAMAAAAALVLSVGVGHELGVRSRPSVAPRPGILTHQKTGAPPYLVYQASADADALSSEDFIAVPFAPPLATGELVTLVHTDLAPEELASLGIDVDSSAARLQADVVMGQDGIPRAVRIAGTSDF